MNFIFNMLKYFWRKFTQMTKKIAKEIQMSWVIEAEIKICVKNNYANLYLNLKLLTLTFYKPFVCVGKVYTDFEAVIKRILFFSPPKVTFPVQSSGILI